MQHLSETLGVFSLDGNQLTLPQGFQTEDHSDIILAPHNGNLWLFSARFWEILVDKLASEDPSDERTSIMRALVLACEVRVRGGKAYLPESIAARLGQGGEVFLDGKPVGTIERQSPA